VVLLLISELYVEGFLSVIRAITTKKMLTTPPPSTNQTTTKHMLQDICPQNWTTIMDSQGYLIYDWYQTLSVRLLGRDNAVKLAKYFYGNQLIFFLAYSTNVIWFVGLFELIPGEVVLVFACIHTMFILTFFSLSCDLDIVKKTMFTDITATSTFILSVIFGVMMGIILNWDFRGISSLIFMIIGMFHALVLNGTASSMRKINVLNTHLFSTLILIALTISFNLGIFPLQLPPSEVTLVTISSIGRFPISIDAYAIMNQSATTCVFIEINSMLHSRKNELMFARVTLRGRDLERRNEDEPNWDEIAQKWDIFRNCNKNNSNNNGAQ
jgi:hypothetical protein